MSKEKNMTKKIFVDIKKCVGCKICEIACAVEHSQSKKLEQAIFEIPSPVNRIYVEVLKQQNLQTQLFITVPLQCKHCEDAPCIAVCPSKALYRTKKDGPVMVDSARCIGCHQCVLVCPFGVIQVNKTGPGVIKCDLCPERTGQGKEPACVSACKTRALIFEESESFSESKRKKAVHSITEEIIK